MSPAELAALAVGGDVRDVTAIERIKQGLTNQSWLVQCALERVVVRIGGGADQALQIDRASEAVILCAVDAADIGAPVLLCDPQRSVLVTRYLGPNWSHSDAQQPGNIARLGRILRQLHAMQPPAQVHSVKLRDVIDGYFQTLQRRSVPHDVPSARARALAAILDARDDACLCHNDVHCLNIVDDGTLRLIDWEYAGIGAPMFDLASVCVYHEYDSAQRNALLDAYAQPAADSPQLLAQACELFDYIRRLWTKVREFN